MLRILLLSLFAISISFSQIISQPRSQSAMSFVGTEPAIYGSENGEFFATCDTNGRVIIKKPEGSGPTIEIEDWKGSKLVVALSVDGGQVFVAETGGEIIRIYGSSSGELINETMVKGANCKMLAISGSGVMAIGKIGEVHLFRVNELKKKSKPFLSLGYGGVLPSSPNGMAFQPGTNNLAVAGDGYCILYDVDAQEVKMKYLQSEQEYRSEKTPLSILAFDPTGQFIAVGDNDKYSYGSKKAVGVDVIHLATGSSVLSKEIGGKNITGIAFDSKSSKLFVSNEAGPSKIVSVVSGLTYSVSTEVPNISIVSSGKNKIMVHVPISSRMAGLDEIIDWDQIKHDKYKFTIGDGLISEEAIASDATSSTPAAPVADVNEASEKKKTATIRLNEVPETTNLKVTTAAEASAAMDKASAAMKSGNFIKAIEVFTKITADQSKNEAAYFGLGLAYQETGQSQKAIEYYQKTLQINPNNLDAQNNIAMIYNLQFNEPEEALDIYKIVAEKKPAGQKAIAYLNMAECYGKLGDKENQKAYYLKALGDDPEYAHGNHRLAFYYFNNGDLQNALNYWKKAQEIDPYNGLYYRNLSVAYDKLGMQNERVSILKQGINIVPVERDQGLNLAYADYLYYDLKDDNASLKYFLNEMDINPGSEVWLNVADIFTSQQQWYKLKTILKSLPSANRSDPNYNFYLGGAEYFSGNKDTGMNLLKQAARAGSKGARNMLNGAGISY